MSTVKITFASVYKILFSNLDVWHIGLFPPVIQAIASVSNLHLTYQGHTAGT